MPIVKLNGPDAMRVRKANALATWGNRATGNRVEPITKPAFETPFQFKPGEKIFTIGSCFARNVEGELIRRGFKIPMRDLFSTAPFKGLEPQIVNNFGTPSIYNELAWAFGEERFDERNGIVEVGADKFVDLHMVSSIRPAPLERVLARRRGLMDATRALADCRVLIMTLGLVEIWWDEQAHTYLNTAPLPGVMRKSPERFSLHVLGFPECHDYLQRALDIAFCHGHRDLRVILTVSPVPMMATHRQMDVISANSYSKSLLRTVAEHIVETNSRVSYFPSYESVTLSDRRIAWMDDLVHVTPEIVGFNVGRMVDAFTGNRHPVETQLPSAGVNASENAESLLLADQARSARALDDASFFEAHKEAAKTSQAFALEYAKFLFAQRDFDGALALLSEDGELETELLRARIFYARRDYAQAAVTAKKVCEHSPKGQAQWQLRLDIAIAQKDIHGIERIGEEWLEVSPARKPKIHAFVASAFRKAGDHQRAVERLSQSGIEPSDAEGFVVVEWAWALLALDKHAEAQEMIENFVPRSDWQVNQIRQIQKRLAA